MFQPGPNDALSQNFMYLGLLVAEKNVHRQTHRQDSCFISIDIIYLYTKLSVSNFRVLIVTCFYSILSHWQGEWGWGDKNYVSSPQQVRKCSSIFQHFPAFFFTMVIVVFSIHMYFTFLVLLYSCLLVLQITVNDVSVYRVKSK